MESFKDKDVADVEDGLQDINSIAHGRYGIRGDRNQKTARRKFCGCSRKGKRKGCGDKQIMPEGMELLIRSDGTKFIREAADEMVFVIFLSVILTSLVCWLLGSLRAAFSVFLTIQCPYWARFYNGFNGLYP